MRAASRRAPPGVPQPYRLQIPSLASRLRRNSWWCHVNFVKSSGMRVSFRRWRCRRSSSSRIFRRFGWPSWIGRSGCLHWGSVGSETFRRAHHFGVALPRSWIANPRMASPNLHGGAEALEFVIVLGGVEAEEIGGDEGFPLFSERLAPLNSRRDSSKIIVRKCGR